MSRHKCRQCGLVNFASAKECVRCRASFESLSDVDDSAAHEGAGATPAVVSVSHVSGGDERAQDDRRASRSLVKRTFVVLGVTLALLLGCYASLIETSDPLSFEQKQLVRRAVEVIERSGFDGDAFMLRRLASYRATDNWWNRWMGHADAYAATNFPFQVVTLYPDFFNYATDDTERAAILLHEARHLAGQGEEKAFAGVWREKARLGWTKERYGHTRVWRNVNEFTLRYAPALFRCGADSRQDCTE